MKIDLMFYELTAEEAHRLTQCAAEMPEPSQDIVKRKRRTKAELAEARDTQAKAAVENNLDTHLAELQEQEIAAEQEEGPRSQGEDDPPTPRRRKRSTEASAGRQKQRPPEEEEKTSPKRQRRRKKADDDEISDADVAKAASEGAKQHTPKVVTGILEEFGVSNVAELSQEQRREFMMMLDTYEAF